MDILADYPQLLHLHLILGLSWVCDCVLVPCKLPFLAILLPSAKSFGLGVIILDLLFFFSLSTSELLSHLFLFAIVALRFLGFGDVIIELFLASSTRYPLFTQKSLSAGLDEKNVCAFLELVGSSLQFVRKTSLFWR